MLKVCDGRVSNVCRLLPVGVVYAVCRYSADPTSDHFVQTVVAILEQLPLKSETGK